MGGYKWERERGEKTPLGLIPNWSLNNNSQQFRLGLLTGLPFSSEAVLRARFLQVANNLFFWNCVHGVPRNGPRTDMKIGPITCLVIYVFHKHACVHKNQLKQFTGDWELWKYFPIEISREKTRRVREKRQNCTHNPDRTFFWSSDRNF